MLFVHPGLLCQATPNALAYQLRTLWQAPNTARDAATHGIALLLVSVAIGVPVGKSTTILPTIGAEAA